MTEILKNLKIGDTVVLACGGRVLIKRNPKLDGAVLLIFELRQEYYLNGQIAYADTPALNITEVIPAAFDWSTVRAGMAFRYDKNQTYFFIGKTPEKICIFCREKRKDDPYLLHFNDVESMKKNMTRAPEHDVEIK